MNSFALRSSASWRKLSAGTSSSWMATSADSCIADGITSLLDWHRLTWSFGCTGCLEPRSEEHTSELQSQSNLVCRLLLEKKKRRSREHWDARLDRSLASSFVLSST